VSAGVVLLTLISAVAFAPEELGAVTLIFIDSTVTFKIALEAIHCVAKPRSAVWPRCGLARCGDARLSKDRLISKVTPLFLSDNLGLLAAINSLPVQPSSAPYLGYGKNITPGTRKELARNLGSLDVAPLSPDPRLEYVNLETQSKSERRKEGREMDKQQDKFNKLVDTLKQKARRGKTDQGSKDSG
jgi:hypothetical protein